jgi:hypothetical protein
MSTKEVLLEVAECLGPNATLFDAIRELEFWNRTLIGLASLDDGNRIAVDEARKLIPRWVTKYSCPPKP